MPKKPAVKELEQKLGELTEALQRERADSVNLRRRMDEERSQLGSFYKSMVVRDRRRNMLSLCSQPRASHKSKNNRVM